MAEKALKKLEDQLNCPICLNTYTDPKQLQCNHVYCQQCLVRLIFRDQQGQPVLTCPNCRQVTPVPASGVAGLQAAFQINQFLDIVEEHKKTKDTTASAERVESISTSPSPHGNTTFGCTEHKGIEVVLYCETCGETICWKCIKKGEKHHSHNYEELKEKGDLKEQITSSLKPMEKQLATIKRALAQLDTRCEEIFNQQATMEANIHDTFTRLHQTLDVRKTELIDQLHRLTQDKFKSLAVQRDQIKTTQAQLSSCLLFMRENLKTGNQEEAVLIKCTTVKELTTTFQPDLLEPNTEADMTFSASADITAVIQNYGRVHKQSSTYPSKCTATGKGIEEAEVGKKSTTYLQTLSIDNLPSKEALDSITCELVSEMTGTRVRGSVDRSIVERRGQNQYEISYQPTIKGRHQLHIKVKGQHIKGSPFPVTARSPVAKLDAPILTIIGVRGPEGVTVSRSGDIVVVAETSGHCVSVFSPSGKRLQSFGTRGSGQGQFQYPNGVVVDGEGCILVTDLRNHRIQKFTARGKCVTAVGTSGKGPLQFQCPSDIAYNASNGKVYVVDNGNGRIQALNSDLSYAGSFGKRGSGNGQFRDPQHLACDSTGNIYVTDHNNHRIQVFTAEGEFLRTFGRRGKGKGELNGPNGIAIDSSDTIYVSEWNNSRVSVFTSKGQFVMLFGGPGQFNSPAGLAVDSSGVLYICDNNRVHVF